MAHIRNIIFDFGGVIYDIDFQKSVVEFQKLGLESFDQLYSKAIQNKLFESFESGLILPDEFVTKLKLLFGKYVDDSQILYAWNALLIGFNLNRLNLLKAVSENYKIYLFSNSNQIHYQIFLNEFKELTKLQSFNDLFEKSFFSFEMKCRKPDAEAYSKVIEGAGLNPVETLFIDDSIQNIKPAKDLGIQTYFLDLSKGEDVCDLFEKGFLNPQVLFNQ